MQDKASAKIHMADKLAALSSNKSVGRKLKAALERLTQDQVEDMDNDPKVAMKALAASIHDFREEVDTIDKAMINRWVTRLEKIKEKLALAEQRSSEAQEQLDVVNWLAEKASKEKKALKNVVGYLRRRLTKWLRIGGFGNSISKRIATDIEQGNGVGKEYKDIAKDLEVSALDCRIVTAWTASKGLANDMVKIIKGATKDDIGKRITTLTDMLAEYYGWGGVMTRIESNLELFEKMDIFSGTTAHWGGKGIHPWCVATRALHSRFGAHAWPIPGFGSLVMSSADSVRQYMYCMPIDAILRKGVSLADAPMFLDTPAGVELAEVVGRLIFVGAGDLVWVHYAWDVLPISCRPEVKSASGPILGRFRRTRVWASSLSAPSSPPTWQSSSLRPQSPPSKSPTPSSSR